MSTYMSVENSIANHEHRIVEIDKKLIDLENFKLKILIIEKKCDLLKLQINSFQNYLNTDYLKFKNSFLETCDRNGRKLMQLQNNLNMCMQVIFILMLGFLLHLFNQIYDIDNELFPYIQKFLSNINPVNNGKLLDKDFNITL